ncbi:MAG: hypothetical protein Q8O46_00040 [bacterium]|nr:hypothetical protein [bacterium]
MKKSSFHILRVGTAITFLWIGILIFQNPEAWGNYLQPWIVNLLPFSVKAIMIDTAILDITIGTLLLFDFLTPWAALVGALHIFSVIAVSGINEATVRDIAIVAGALAIFNDSLTSVWREKLLFWKKTRP